MLQLTSTFLGAVTILALISSSSARNVDGVWKGFHEIDPITDSATTTAFLPAERGSYLLFVKCQEQNFEVGIFSLKGDEAWIPGTTLPVAFRLGHETAIDTEGKVKAPNIFFVSPNMDQAALRVSIAADASIAIRITFPEASETHVFTPRRGQNGRDFACAVFDDCHVPTEPG